jgi:hypothetical protein
MAKRSPQAAQQASLSDVNELKPSLPFVTLFATVTNVMTKRRCRYCGKPFEVNERGRARDYCSRSHRERAYEKRKAAEFKTPSERQFRLLNERIATLARQRRKWAAIDETVGGMVGRDPKSIRSRPYSRSVDSVQAILTELAPEVLRASQAGSAQGTVDLTSALKIHHRLANQHHPDHGGNVETMKALNELWQAVETDVGLGVRK